MALNNNIAQEITNLNADIRAEVIVDQILQNKVSWNELFVHCNKFFYRNFSRDIYSTTLDVENNYRDILHINLSRAGLYDLLPEGLFFQPVESSTKPSSAAEMAEEYKRNKKHENELRKFFSPLENEFFYHRYKNFHAEKEIINGLNNDDLNRYYIKFWNLAKDISPSMALRIVLLLPFIHQVAGDADLMAGCLQSILGEEVNCRIQNSADQSPSVHYNILGNFGLGNELICGNHYAEDEICFVFKIGALKHSAAQDYLEGGRYYKTIQSFFRFFVPVNAEIKTEIIVGSIKQQMKIGFMEEATLGIATVI